MSGPAQLIREIPNAAARRMADRRLLSVLVPFYGLAPSELLKQLAEAAAGREDTVEVLCGDDGSPDPAPGAALVDIAAGMALPVRMLRAETNLGRSRIRNRLAEAARGEHLLYLDGDVQLPTKTFLAAYLDLLGRGPVDVAFGGFEMPGEAADGSPYALHVYDSRRSHCLPAAERQRDAGKYAYTSNLLVRRSLMLAFPFCEEFTGWGWEDVDWSLRVGDRAQIHHIENPVIHAGFSTPEALLSKFRESVENFHRLCRRHPDKVRRLRLFKMSLLCSRVPFGDAIEAALASVMLGRGRWPLRVRYMSMKLLRAFLYRNVARSAGRS